MNTGSYVSSRLMIACWIVGIRLSDVGMACSCLSLRLAPGSKGVASARDERLVHGRTVSPRRELHVHGGGLGVPCALVLDQQLLDHAVQELNPGLPLPCPDETGAADLVEQRGRALL